MSILLVEDDERIVEFLRRGLGARGYVVEVARSGSEGLELGRRDGLAIIILDLNLPEIHGREVCQRLRIEGIKTPIIMLTAMGEEQDIVEGLRLGADDYLTKPFSFPELAARIEALIRRSGGYEDTSQRLQVSDLVFDLESLEVLRGGRSIELTSKEMALLELLMSKPGRVVSRAQILNNVWGVSRDPLTNIVDVYIQRLRAKIDEGREGSLIKTIRGRGYRMLMDAA